MSKAFDFVDHKILLDKCETYGIRGNTLQWINSYLSNRTQCVELHKLNDARVSTSFRSSFEVNRFGVPQGSVLGPLLFLLYINDIPQVTGHDCILFADDISVVVTENKNINYELSLNHTIASIMKWLNSNNLTANIAKTKILQFSNYNKNNIFTNLTLKYQNVIIEEIHETKFLGIILDRNCNWKAHTDKLCSNINRFVYALRRLKKVSCVKTTLAAYHGYIGSVLRYGLLLWGNSTYSNKVFLSQKKCIRAICGAGPLESCRPLFKKLGLLTLTSLYILEIGIFVKKHPELYAKATEFKKFASRDPTRLAVSLCRSTLCQKNCYIMSIKIFNKIPKHIRELPLNHFKIKLKKCLVQSCFYTINEFLTINFN